MLVLRGGVCEAEMLAIFDYQGIPVCGPVGSQLATNSVPRNMGPAFSSDERLRCNLSSICDLIVNEIQRCPDIQCFREISSLGRPYSFKRSPGSIDFKTMLVTPEKACICFLDAFSTYPEMLNSIGVSNLTKELACTWTMSMPHISSRVTLISRHALLLICQSNPFWFRHALHKYGMVHWRVWKAKGSAGSVHPLWSVRTKSSFCHFVCEANSMLQMPGPYKGGLANDLWFMRVQSFSAPSEVGTPREDELEEELLMGNRFMAWVRDTIVSSSSSSASSSTAAPSSTATGLPIPVASESAPQRSNAPSLVAVSSRPRPAAPVPKKSAPSEPSAKHAHLSKLSVDVHPENQKFAFLVVNHVVSLIMNTHKYCTFFSDPCPGGELTMARRAFADALSRRGMAALKWESNLSFHHASAPPFPIFIPPGRAFEPRDQPSSTCVWIQFKT